ncbi:phospholipase [Chitinophaga silvatica]|uniref:Phospholipase n=1 Tax=Chitinophaga silvatica TaxID=2282649 RepID=A0A3E1YDE0_9BACT|nr:prolyl oligopeptidase family serine peptidase [Chitinophaga silvatica]RFS24532.1 phospholipase [Chitinophaga silvatica]
MKKRKSKNFVYVFLSLFLVLTACSKNETKDLVDEDKTPPPVEDKFTPQDAGFSFKKLATTTDNITDYLMYIPEGYNEKKTYKWPIVFFLHGVGEMGANVSVLKQVGLSKVVQGKQFIMIAPLCNKGWWNPAALEKLYKEVMAELHVDTTRVYLTGLSMGGYGTWDWGSYYAEHFAAMVPICGGGSVDRMQRLKSMPIWVFHSADDGTVNVSESRVLVDALKKLGSNVKYTEYPDGGHDAWTRAYNTTELYTWLLQQHK